MNREELTEIVQQVIAESIGSETELDPDFMLLESGLIDSVTILQIFLSLQSETGLALDAEDITEETFESPNSIVAMLQAKQ